MNTAPWRTALERVLLVNGGDPAVRILRRAALVYVLFLIVVLLYPFNFRLPVEHVENGAGWSPGGRGLVFSSAGMVHSAAPPRQLYDRLAGGDGLTVEVWARAATVEQTGPARIVSYSLDLWHRNVTLGQEGADLIIRLRTTRTDENGRSPSLLVPGVFVPGVMRHIVTSYDLERQRVYVDGELRLSAPIPGGALTPWDPSHRLVFGNEFIGSRPWIGTLRAAAFYDQALDAGAIRARYRTGRFDVGEGPEPVAGFDWTGTVEDDAVLPGAVGDAIRLVRPPDISSGDTQVLSFLVDADLHTTFHAGVYAWDIAGNVLLFVPFGIAAFACAAAREWRCLYAICLAVVVAGVMSLVAEVLQAFLVSRDSSLVDVLSNAAGAAAGAAVAALVWSASAHRSPAPQWPGG